MNATKLRRPVFLVLACTILFFQPIFGGSGEFATMNRQEQDDESPRVGQSAAFDVPRAQVNQGAEEAAIEYYKEVISPHLGLKTPETILSVKMDDLFKYFGYTNVESRAIHSLSSKDIMSLGTGDEILASRFFAPKVTDVSDRPKLIPKGGFGWRKLVRLNAKSGSDAEAKQISAMFLLQNNFEENPLADPFAEEVVSKFNQVILVRNEGTISGSRRAAYFMVFGPLVKLDDDGSLIRDAEGKLISDGSLTTFLKATFDDDRDPETNLEAEKYFVPDACIQCHGRSSRRGKLNMLDTDHWFDRVHPSYAVNDGAGVRYRKEDFVALSFAEKGILFDSVDMTLENAFDVIRKINGEIKEQNSVAGGSSFQRLSVEKWLEKHSSGNDNHIAPYDRGFGSNTWDPQNQDHRKLLYFLNRYCYRCHSTIRFNVFDRQRVKGLVDNIRSRLLDIEDPRSWMPQDRIISGLIDENNDGVVEESEVKGDLKEFLELLRILENEN